MDTQQLQFSITYSQPQIIYPKSPLRYPGGKARAVSQILALIPKETQILISPFFGGGSIEIAAAFRGIKVFGFDIFDPLVNFWKFLLRDSIELANRVKTHYPLSKDKFYDLQKHDFSNSLESAAVFYVLNRSSFSGATLSGGMSPGHPRFTLSSIAYLQNFKCENLFVEKQDFKKTFQKYQKELMYLDPPYLIKSTLYGKKGDAHKEFDHNGLFELLKKRDKWILSYNDCPEIRSLYFGYRYFSPNWKYGMSNDKNSRELIIISNDFSDIEWEKNG